VARTFARLKLRLLRNGLRSPQYAMLFTVGAVGAGLLAFLGFVSLAALRNDSIAGDATIVAFGAVTAAWIVVPLLGFGTDETLDPQRLALLPLPSRTLLRGLLTAALIGVAPVATALGLSGALLALAHNLTAVVLILAAIAGTIALCVVGSRTMIALLAPLLRSRRGRDLMVMTVVIIAFVPNALRLFAMQSGVHNVRHTFSVLAGRIRYTPFGLGGVAAADAGRGDTAAALAALVLLAALIGVLLVIWSLAIPRAMSSADIAAPTEPKQRAAGAALPLFPRALPFLSRNRAGAVTAKELRYYVRDPRRRGPLIAALVLPAVFLFSSMREAHTRPAPGTLLALIALLPASGLTLNQFGLDGAALWSTIVSGNDPGADLLGKNTATMLLVVPLVAIPGVAAAAVTHGWAYLPLTIGLAPGMLGVILAVGNAVSAWAPYALPDRQNPLAANPGQGCVGALAALGALLVDGIVLLPVLGVTFVALTVTTVPIATAVSVLFATAYGGVVWLLGRRAAARHLWWRMPELLEAVSPRQAG
jgi:ABC-2 type transport system permease protein